MVLLNYFDPHWKYFPMNLHDRLLRYLATGVNIKGQIVREEVCYRDASARNVFPNACV